MLWVWEELISGLLAGAGELFEMIANKVLKCFGLGTDGFNTYASILVDNYEIITGLGMGLAFLIMLMALLKLLFAPFFEDVENPILLIGRFWMAILLVYKGKTIGYYIMDFFSNFYEDLMDLGQETSSNVGSLIPGIAGSGGAYAIGTVASGTFPVVGAIITCVTAIGTLIALLFGFVLIVILAVEFFKLVLEGLERYIFLNLLIMFYPLAGAAITSATTTRIFFTYVKMTFCEAFLVCMNVLFIKGSVFIMQNSFTETYDTADASAQGGMIIAFIFLMAFMKTGQRIDSYMKTMGLDVAQTGGSILDEMFAAGRAAMGISRAAGKAFNAGSGIGGQALNNLKNAFAKHFPDAKQNLDFMKNGRQSSMPGSKEFKSDMNAATSGITDMFKKNGSIPEGHAKTIAKGMQAGDAGMSAIENRCGSPENYGELLKKVVPGLNGMNIQGAELVKNGPGRGSDNKLNLGNGVTGTLSYNKPTNGTPFKTLKDINGKNMYLSTGGAKVAGRAAVKAPNATRAAVSKALGMDVNGFNNMGGNFAQMAAKNGASWGGKTGTPAQLGFNANKLESIMQNASNPRQALALMTGNKADAFDGMTYSQIANSTGMVGEKEGKLADIGFDEDKIKNICETGSLNLPALMGDEQYANDKSALANALGISEEAVDNLKCQDIGDGSVAMFDENGNLVGTLDTPDGNNLNESIGHSIANEGDLCDYKVNPNTLAGMDSDMQAVTDEDGNMYSKAEMTDAINDTLGKDCTVADIGINDNVATASMTDGSEVYMDQGSLNEGNMAMLTSDTSARETFNSLRDGELSYNADSDTIVASGEDGMSASIPATALNSSDAIPEESFASMAPNEALQDVSSEGYTTSTTEDAVNINGAAGGSASIPLTSMDNSQAMDMIRDDLMTNIGDSVKAGTYTAESAVALSDPNGAFAQISFAKMMATPQGRQELWNLEQSEAIVATPEGGYKSNSDDYIVTGNNDVYKVSDVWDSVKSGETTGVMYGDTRENMLNSLSSPNSAEATGSAINFKTNEGMATVPVSSISSARVGEEELNSLVSSGVITKGRDNSYETNSNDYIATKDGVFAASKVKEGIQNGSISGVTYSGNCNEINQSLDSASTRAEVANETISVNTDRGTVRVSADSMGTVPLMPESIKQLKERGDISSNGDGTYTTHNKDYVATSTGVYNVAELSNNIRNGHANDITYSSNSASVMQTLDNSTNMKARAIPETVNYNTGTEKMSMPTSSIKASPLSNEKVESLVSNGTITRSSDGTYKSNSNDYIATSKGIYNSSDVIESAKNVTSSGGRASFTSEGHSAVNYSDGTVISSTKQSYTNTAVEKFNSLSSSTPNTVGINERGSVVSKYDDGVTVTGRQGKYASTDKGIYDRDSVANSMNYATKDRTPTSVSFNSNATSGTMKYDTGVQVTTPTIRNENTNNYTVNASDAGKYSQNVSSLNKTESDRLYESVKGKERGGTPTRVSSEPIKNGVRHKYSNGEQIDTLHPMPGEEGDKFELRGNNVLVRDGLNNKPKKPNFKKGQKNNS